MSTTQSPQDEIAAMQATLALHAEDLERIKQWIPETREEMRSLWQNISDELTSTRDSITQELRAIHERLDAHTERLDAHTERLDAQAAAQANTNLEIAGIKETLAALVARTDGIVEEMGAMSRTLNETNSRVGNLTGSRYERRVARSIRGRMRRSIGLAQAQVLHRDWGETDDALLALLDDADDSGVISLEEREDLLDADIIAAGKDATGADAYAVVEISVTVSSTDVNRAARRARTLARATGDGCSAIVVGSEIPPAEQERAQRSAVAVVAIAEQVDSLI